MFFIKKLLLIIAGIISLFVYNKDKNQYDIPIESIRIRIIANSNSNKDQETKILVKNNIEKYIYNLTKDSNSLEETRNIINDNFDELDSIINKTLKDSNIKTNYNIKYGINYFPNKKYHNKEYDSGNYESLVITLGKGEGDNWWCVLFPPLCLMDSKDNETDNIEYEFIVKKIIKHFM